MRAKNVRHNLVVLRDMALEKGFKSYVAEIDQIVAIIGDNYAAHDYRYMKPNATLRYVFGDGVIPVIQSFVDKVALDLGLPIRSGGTTA